MKLRTEFERLLNAVAIMDRDWAVEFCQSARNLKQARSHDELRMYRIGIMALRTKIAGASAGANLMMRCAIAVNDGKKATAAIDPDELNDSIVALAAMWQGHTEKRIACKIVGVEPRLVYIAIQRLIDVGKLELQDHWTKRFRQLYAVMPVPRKEITGPDGKIEFCGMRLSQHQLAAHPSNVHDLTRQAISKRIKGGMSALEALTTPRMRKSQ